jgi:hypothetical protein
VHQIASARTAGGTYSIGALTIHWQHRSRGSSSLHRSVPQQHYLTVSSLH